MNAQAKHIEREQREREARERLAQLAQEIGAELGAPVSDIPRAGCEPMRGHWYLNLVDGGQVCLSLNWRDEADGKLIASWHSWGHSGFEQILPRDVANYTERNVGLPSFDARISMDKGAKRIAAEIQRRVIEVARPWYLRCVEAADRANQAKLYARETAKLLAEVMDVELQDRHSSNDGKTWTIYAGPESKFYYVRVSSFDGVNASVEFDRVSSMDQDKAIKLIQFLRDL